MNVFKKIHLCLNPKKDMNTNLLSQVLWYIESKSEFLAFCIISTNDILIDFFFFTFEGAELYFWQFLTKF